jgi:hypothetical protein
VLSFSFTASPGPWRPPFSTSSTLIHILCSTFELSGLLVLRQGPGTPSSSGGPMFVPAASYHAGSICQCGRSTGLCGSSPRSMHQPPALRPNPA